MATHSSIVAWRIPWTGESSGLQPMGSQRVGHDWVHTHTHKIDNAWEPTIEHREIVSARWRQQKLAQCCKATILQNRLIKNKIKSTKYTPCGHFPAYVTGLARKGTNLPWAPTQCWASCFRGLYNYHPNRTVLRLKGNIPHNNYARIRKCTETISLVSQNARTPPSPISAQVITQSWRTPKTIGPLTHPGLSAYGRTSLFHASDIPVFIFQL